MQKLKIITTLFVILFVTSALIKTTESQASDEMQLFFSKKYIGISIQVNATKETVPSVNMTVSLLVNCTADGVYVNFLNLSVYGYSHFRYGLDKMPLCAVRVINNTSLSYHNITEHNYTIPIPDSVWDLTYADLRLNYSIEGSPYPYEEYTENFLMTNVRNVLWEELEEKLTQLNETFWNSFGMNLTVDNLAYINRTLWELQQNYTALKGSLNELDNTRNAVAVLSITSVFFVATTLYLVMRKPKEYY